MFCPKCGYEQTGKETRFCSRCGFQLSVVTGLLSTNGMLPNPEFAPPPQPLQPPPISRRKKRIRQGGKMMFLSLMVLVPIFGFFSAAIEEGFPMIVPFLVFLAGMTWSLYNFLFAEDDVVATTPAAYRQQPVNQQQLNAPPFLFQPPTHAPHPEPQQMTVPASQRLKTSEIVQPPSVTEGTTRFFEKERS